MAPSGAERSGAEQSGEERGAPAGHKMAAAAAGLRASYHRLLDRIELVLPPRLRPFYNHPAGNGPQGSPWERGRGRGAC